MAFAKFLTENTSVIEEDRFNPSINLVINPPFSGGRRGSSNIESYFHPRMRTTPYIYSRKFRPASTATKEYRFVGKNGFQVSICVQEFKHNELVVKIIDNNICIEGKHEEREDEFGTVSRHFKRIIALPKEYDPQSVTSTLSSDGLLTIKAKPPKSAESAKERIIKIEHTGPADETVKSNAVANPTEEASVQENGEESSAQLEE